MQSIQILEMTGVQHDGWLTAWRTSSEPRMSAFSHPAYSRAAARNGLDVRVWMDNDFRGFFPIQRTGHTGCPVGGRLADFSGAVWPTDLPFDGQAMLNCSELKRWVLPNSTAPTAALATYRHQPGSAHIDLTLGYGHWLADLQKHHSATSKQVARKARKLARELGPLRLEQRAGDEALLLKLLSWKNDQRRRSGSVDLFEQSWAKSLAKDIMNLAEDGCFGTLDVLYAGDALLAIHLGLRAGDRLHWWVPAYNERYSRFSPGLVMLFEMARTANQRNLNFIDLGPGDERYKASVANGSVPLYKSALHGDPIEREVFRLKEQTRLLLRGTALSNTVKQTQRQMRRGMQWLRTERRL